MKPCLDCKYEPNWSEPSGTGEGARRGGECRYKVEMPKLPSVCRVTTSTLTRYSDDSGLPTSCPTWEGRPSPEDEWLERRIGDVVTEIGKMFEDQLFQKDLVEKGFIKEDGFPMKCWSCESANLKFAWAESGGSMSIRQVVAFEVARWVEHGRPIRLSVHCSIFGMPEWAMVNERYRDGNIN